MPAPRRRDMLRARLRADHLVRNSVFILLSNGAMGGLGFAFWLVAAHLFTAGQVGVATSLVTAMILISYASLLGFNSTFVRFLPSSTERDVEIDTGLALVFFTALVLSAIYVAVVPSLVHQLEFVRRSPLYATGFVILTAFSAVNLVTDSVFIAYREAKYNFIVDGVLQSVTKLALPFVLVASGAFGIFASVGISAGVAVALSLFYMLRAFGYRLRLRVSWTVVRRVLHYSAANYLANVLTILPILLLPLIALRGLGSAAAGYYYIAYQISNMLFMASYAVAQSLFAEGSHADTEIRQLAIRSARLQVVVLLPAVAVIAAGGHLILSLFGHNYAAQAPTTLLVFALSVPAVALNGWTSTLMRVQHQLGFLLWSNVVFVAATGGLAVWWMHWSLPWLATAWLLGNLLSGLVGLVAVTPLLRAAPIRSTAPHAIIGS